MKKVLLFINSELYYFKDGERVIGNCSGLRGDCSYLSGDCSGLVGDCSDLSGDCTYLRGDCTDLSGDLDEAKITDTERKKGINIKDLIKKEIGEGKCIS